MAQGVKRRFQNQESVEDKQTKTEEKKPRSVAATSLVVGGLLSLFAGLSICFVIYQQMVVSVRQNQLEDFSTQKAELTADAVTNYLKSIEQNLEYYTRKPLLSASLVGEDRAYLDTVEQDVIKQVNNVVSVKLITKGMSKLDRENFPPVRFSELEMIQRAERRENVLPEAVRLENKWYVNFVLPAPKDSNQDAVGVMLVVIDINELRERVSKVIADDGRASLYQNFTNSKPQQILSVGEAELPSSKTIMITQSYWKVEFIPSTSLLNQTHVDTTKVYLILSVSFGLILLLGFLASKKVGRGLEEAINRKQASPDVDANVSQSLQSDFINPIYQSSDILDVDITEEDEDLLGLGDEVLGGAVDPNQNVELDILDIDDDDEKIPEEIFRAYDIRGIAKTQITNEVSRKIGQALGSEAVDCGDDTLIVARDARTHSPEITEWFIRGVLSTGCNVLNIGTVPTPLLYFATETLEQSQSGVMITASHNPAEYNGFKIVMGGKSRNEAEIQAVKSRVQKRDFYQGSGQEFRHDVVSDYIDTIFSDVALAGDISIVVDAGNGVTGVVAPRLFEELGCQVTPLYCDLDGTFPNHGPDPSVEENLQDLIAKVQDVNADLGVAFDGDGDRLAVVTPSGKIIWPDKLLMLFAKDVVARNPGADVVFDVKCTRLLNECISSAGGRPIMWKTGHSPMKEKMVETGALLGGEFSGHIFIKDRWYGFDDGMYAAARLIEIISLQGEDLDMVFGEFGQSLSTPEIRVECSEEKKNEIIAALSREGDFLEGKINTIDGVRVDFPKGWGLVRASNTLPGLTLRFEADDEEFMHKLKGLFVRELRKIDNSINVDWKQ